MTQANRRRGWAALMPAQSKIALHASAVDEIKTDTPPAWMSAPSMGAILEVKVLPRADHSERNEVQLREGDRAWEGSME